MSNERQNAGARGRFQRTPGGDKRLLRLAAWAAAAVASSCGVEGDRASFAQPAELSVPAAAGSGQPHLAVGPAGELVLSWLEPAGAGYALRLAELEDGRWGEARTVAQGDDFFVNWADFPSVVPIADRTWAAHWLVLAPDSFHAYDIVVSVSGDAGHTWGEPFKLHDDGTETEHGFVSLFPWHDGIGAVWLDGRNLADVDYDAFDADGGGDPIGVSLRYARLGYDGQFLEQGEIDTLVCDCCPTDVAVAAGVPVLAYRDRTPEEIRDVVVRTADAAEWSAPARLGPDEWHITGCPVNGPAAAADGQSVAVAWFTGADDRPRVQLAYSGDGGSSFAAPIEVDADGAFGHVGVVLLDDGDAVVSWWRRNPEAQGLMLAARRVAADGTLGAVRQIAASASLRPIDVPQMARVADGLVFAWTDAEGEGVVRSASTGLP